MENALFLQLLFYITFTLCLIKNKNCFPEISDYDTLCDYAAYAVDVHDQSPAAAADQLILQENQNYTDLYGTHYYKNNEIYTGILKEKKREGYGKLNYPNGTEFIGNFHEDKANGPGIKTHNDGGKIIGFWNQNQLEGLGIFIWPDDTRLYGYFDKQDIIGAATWVFKDKSIFVAHQDSKTLSGEAILLLPNNEMYVGNAVGRKRMVKEPSILAMEKYTLADGATIK